MTFPQRPSITTTTGLTSKGFLCHTCRVRKPIVTRGIDGKDICDDCVDPKRRSLVTLVED